FFRLQEYKSENAQLEELLTAEERKEQLLWISRKATKDLSTSKVEVSRVESHMVEALAAKNLEIDSLVNSLDTFEETGLGFKESRLPYKVLFIYGGSCLGLEDVCGHHKFITSVHVCCRSGKYGVHHEKSNRRNTDDDAVSRLSGKILGSADRRARKKKRQRHNGRCPSLTTKKFMLIEFWLKALRNSQLLDEA
ncbi:hypothetical protein IFM89_038589, partial [Coptis chinensis]